MINGPGRFAVSMDMNLFRPEDIEVGREGIFCPNYKIILLTNSFLTIKELFYSSEFISKILISVGRLVVSAEREVSLDRHTSVICRFRRRIVIPADVGTDALAVQMDELVYQSFHLSIHTIHIRPLPPEAAF